MMQLTILCVGRLKEDYWKDAVKEYEKRLSRYVKLAVIEVADEKAPEKLSREEEKQILLEEGERLLKKIPEGSYVITLEIQGKRFSSEGFSRRLEQLSVQGESRICLVIGGSLGLSDEVRNLAREAVSFSEMTFPHQLMRVILLEQLYRAFKIQNNEPYHK